MKKNKKTALWIPSLIWSYALFKGSGLCDSNEFHYPVFFFISFSKTLPLVSFFISSLTDGRLCITTVAFTRLYCRPIIQVASCISADPGPEFFVEVCLNVKL